jgi:hypothetical protein
LWVVWIKQKTMINYYNILVGPSLLSGLWTWFHTGTMLLIDEPCECSSEQGWGLLLRQKTHFRCRRKAEGVCFVELLAQLTSCIGHDMLKMSDTVRMDSYRVRNFVIHKQASLGLALSPV